MDGHTAAAAAAPSAVQSPAVAAAAAAPAAPDEQAALRCKIDRLEQQINELDQEITEAKGEGDKDMIKILLAKQTALRADKTALQEEKILLLKAQQSSAPLSGGPSHKTVYVSCPFVAREPFLLTLSAGVTLHTAISAKLKKDLQSSGGRLKRNKSLEDLGSMHVFKQGVRVTDFDDILDQDQLEFRWSGTLIAESGSCWGVEHLRQLKIEFSPAHCAADLLEPAFGLLPPVSDRVAHVLDIFEGVGADFLRDEYPKEIKELREVYGRASAAAAAAVAGAAGASPAFAVPAVSSSAASVAASERDAARRRRLLHPLYKCLYMMSKFPTNESLVDDFVTALLRELMANQPDSDWQHICPQLSMPLIFGGIGGSKITQCDAIADRLIVDVDSFYRMAVFEDKSIKEMTTNSEPQLIAEAIAAHQANMRLKEEPSAKKPKLTGTSPAESSASSGASNSASAASSSASAAMEPLDPLLAVRVSGHEFFFYCVSVTPQLMLAMETMTEAGSETLVRKLCRWEEGQPHGLSFYSAADRRVIVEVLDAMCQCIARAGSVSRRRESGASAEPPHKLGAQRQRRMDE